MTDVILDRIATLTLISIIYFNKFQMTNANIMLKTALILQKVKMNFPCYILISGASKANMMNYVLLQHLA